VDKGVRSHDMQQGTGASSWGKNYKMRGTENQDDFFKDRVNSADSFARKKFLVASNCRNYWGQSRWVDKQEEKATNNLNARVSEREGKSISLRDRGPGGPRTIKEGIKTPRKKGEIKTLDNRTKEETLSQTPPLA